jgi:hypothetical protein
MNLNNNKNTINSLSDGVQSTKKIDGKTVISKYNELDNLLGNLKSLNKIN